MTSLGLAGDYWAAVAREDARPPQNDLGHEPLLLAIILVTRRSTFHKRVRPECAPAPNSTPSR
jgi:hypothetical protein